MEKRPTEEKHCNSPYLRWPLLLPSSLDSQLSAASMDLDIVSAARRPRTRSRAKLRFFATDSITCPAYTARKIPMWAAEAMNTVCTLP
jgi:hypothetical protein